MSARAIRRASEREAARREHGARKSSTRKRVLIGAGATLGAAAVAAPAAQGATYEVENTDDSGPGSLRDAIADAEANTGVADTIVFDSSLSGGITLTSDEIEITEALDIQGPGADVLYVSGDDSYRIFYIDADSLGEDISISGLTLTEGVADSGPPVGGALSSLGADLTLTDSVVTDNAAPLGGGVAVQGGTLTIERTAFFYNLALNGGGLLTAGASGGSVVRDSTISANLAFVGGGGVSVNATVDSLGPAGILELERTTISGNGAGLFGGGIGGGAYYGPVVIPGAPFRVDQTTVSANGANFGGGIAFAFGYGPVEVVDSTVSGNYAADTGGGINVPIVYDGDLEVRNSTVAANDAEEFGGGIVRNSDAPVVSSSIVANNAAPEAPDIGDGEPEVRRFGSGELEPRGFRGEEVPFDGERVSEGLEWLGSGESRPRGNGSPPPEGPFEIGFSLVEDPSGATIAESPAGSNIFGADPQLEGLGDNGGPTETHAPALSSPAIDAGIATGLTTDQRGEPRTVDQLGIPNPLGADGTDMGSVELPEGGLTDTCQGQPARLFASGPAGETLTGTGGADLMRGGDGDDTLRGVGGPDCLFGDAGNDQLEGGGGADEGSGGDGDDRLDGDAGSDRLDGAAGRDELTGRGGKDRLFGQAGKDRLKGNGGKDNLKGGPGKDNLKGQGGKDKLNGQGGKDKLNGGGSKDKLRGGGGKDKLRGGPAKDKLKGQGGRDKINAVDEKRDKVNCGGGNDRTTVDPEDKVSGNCEKVIVKD